MDIKFHRLKDITKETVAKLIPLSMRKGGTRIVFLCLSGEFRDIYLETFGCLRISIAYDKRGEPIAWALLDREGVISDDENLASVFVKKTYRKRGLGKLLLDHLSICAKVPKEKMSFAPWNPENTLFFTKSGLLESNRKTTESYPTPPPPAET